jgi:hypothetical protein
MLKRTFSILSAGLFLGITSMTVLANANKQAGAGKLPKNCQYLKEVATNQTHIRKKIDAMIGKNFDTDFAVPAGVKFASFKGIVLPENEGTYGVTINLKYADNSISSALRKDVSMKSGETYSLPFQSPTGRQPYQINFNINGANNNAYTIAVMACK